MSKILPELDNFELSSEIKDKAREIYTQISSKNRRGKTRKRYIFYCVYHAYLDLGYLIDQDEVAKKVQLERDQISLSKNIVPDRGSEYKPNRVVVRDINECLMSYYDEFFMDRSLYPKLVSDVKKLLTIGPEIKEMYPQIAASLIVCIFAEKLGFEVDKMELATKLHIKWPILAVSYRLISKIYQSIE